MSGSKQTWRLSHTAIIAVALILASAHALSLAPWCDEVAFVDPGAQLALTGKMISTAWVTNSPETLWGSSNPGMSLVFAGWFKLVGFGQVQARLLFCLFHFAGVALLFQWVRRRFNPEPWPLVLGIISSVLLPCLANAIFEPRLECLAFLLCAWFLHYAYEEERGFLLDWVAPPALGLTIIFFGLHFAGFFALAAICVFALSPGRRTFLLGAGLAVGLVAGMVILRAVYVRMGMWDTFVAARACHYGRIIYWVPLGWKRYGAPQDVPFLAVLAGFGLLSAASVSGWKPVRSWTPWLWAVGVFFLVPLLIGRIGIYYANYSWMAALPMMLCFYFGAPSLVGRWRTAFVSALVIGIFVFTFKFTRRLPDVIRETERRQEAINVIREILPKGSAVGADFPFYYQLAGAGYRVFPRMTADAGICLGFEQEFFMPKAVREKIKCVVTRKHDAASALSGIGGEWKLFGGIPSPQGGTASDDLEIYVRK